MVPDRKFRRCAVYTRKSSEEGLEQEFNSLQAQREACEAFIRSQRGEGWQLIGTPYDDGGISGGTMERPGLQRLLVDIEAGKIDVVVVYKVDRLTRSLPDFARMVEVFDRKGVSFVAVTQQFNTTTSMGRLTLNVLLSFAQFEREVTGERIRDKIAASKKKGMWMGGPTPLGYRVENRKLYPVPEEAERVREIYRRYLDASSVQDLLSELRRDGILSKQRWDKPATHFSRGALFALLSNPIYIGQVRHRSQCYPGQQEAIVDAALWEQVQVKLKAGAVRKGVANRKTETSPLMGKLVDETGCKLRPSHALKQGRRYRYYVSVRADEGDERPCLRLPAREIELRVETIVRQALDDRAALLEAARCAGIPDRQWQQVFAAAATAGPWDALVDQVTFADTELRISLHVPFEPVIHMERAVPLELRRRGVEARLVIPGLGNDQKPVVDPIVIKMIGRALRWWEWLTTGVVGSQTEISEREGIHHTYVVRVLPLALLSPAILEAIATGRQPADFTTQTLLQRKELPMCWKAQRQAFGFN